MNFEEQVKAHKELSRKIDALELEKKALGLAILEQMDSKSVSVGDFIVKRYTRLTFKLSVL